MGAACHDLRDESDRERLFGVDHSPLQDQDPRLVVRLEALIAFFERPRGIPVNRVTALWPVYGQHCGEAAALVADRLTHGCSYVNASAFAGVLALVVMRRGRGGRGVV